MTWSCLLCPVGACHACTGRVTIHRPDSTGEPARDEPCEHRCLERAIAAVATRRGRSQTRSAARCHPARVGAGRGLCQPCWKRAQRAGTLADHPRAVRTGAEFAEDYRALAAQGCRRELIAERMGMRPRTFEQALYRARRDGRLPQGTASA